MRRIIVDTNVFLRFLLGDIPSQKKEAENLFKMARKGSIKIIIPQIIIFEIEFILRKYYKFPVAVISSKIKSLLNAEFFQISERTLFLKSLEIHQSKNISFVDSFLISFAELEDLELFSFDKKLLKT